MQAVSRVLIPVLFLFWTIGSSAALAQEAPQNQEVRRIEQRLEELKAELEALSRQLDALRAPSAEEDLTQVEPVEQPPAQPEQQAQPPAPAEPPVLDPQLVPNVLPVGASKVFNPDIAVIGNFVGFLGENPVEEGPSATLEEVELSFQAFVDPYAKANFFVAVTEEGAEIEEGFINFITLPRDFTAKVGKMRASFGKVNFLHSHQLPWIDVPLVTETFFGEEGMADSGVSVSKLLPNRYNLFLEATGEIFSGNVEDVFEAQEKNDLLYLGHVRAYRDITERTNFEVGTSYARGTLPGGAGTSQFAGVDLTIRYKPLERAIYQSFISRTEVMFNDRDDVSDRAMGFFTSADYQFSRRWFAGIRLDQVDRPDDPSFTDRSGSFTLTFWPSEWSQIRAQFRHINFDQSPDANELLLQFNFSIGAHGAHVF